MDEVTRASFDLTAAASSGDSANNLGDFAVDTNEPPKSGHFRAEARFNIPAGRSTGVTRPPAPQARPEALIPRHMTGSPRGIDPVAETSGSPKSRGNESAAELSEACATNQGDQ